MKNYFAHRGQYKLNEVKNGWVDKIIFKAENSDFAHKVCLNKWSKDTDYKLYCFENFHKNDTFMEVAKNG